MFLMILEKKISRLWREYYIVFWSNFKIFHQTLLTTSAICPSITFHSHSSLSPTFSFHCLTILIGIVVRNEANFEDALVATVLSPILDIILYLSLCFLRTLPSTWSVTLPIYFLIGA